MAGYPKFFIAKNPLADPSGVYIYHARKPRFLAKVEGASFEVMDDIDSMLDFYHGDVGKVHGLISRMSDWYKTYKLKRDG